MPSPSVPGNTPNGGPSGGGPQPSDKWWKPIGGNGGGLVVMVVVVDPTPTTKVDGETLVTPNRWCCFILD